VQKEETLSMSVISTSVSLLLCCPATLLATSHVFEERDVIRKLFPASIDRGWMHEPQDNSRDYLPDVTASDDEEDGLILSLLSSKPGVIAPSVLIPRCRGGSVEVRIPAGIAKSPRA